MRYLLIGALLACGGEEAPAEPTSAPTETTTAETPTETPELPEPEPEADPSASWVELLHALPGTWVSTSSAYRNEARQVARMVDGDLETAWNSHSEESAPSIFIRVPEGAVMHAIELTVGYTKMQGERDLFTGNRRIRTLRVFDPSQEVTLDPDSRELQRVVFDTPITTGEVRLTVAEFAPGSNEDWTEICISELRVLGVAPDAQPDTRTPMTFLGHLPPRDGEAMGQTILDRVREDADAPMDVGRPLRSFSGTLGEDPETLSLRVSGDACYTLIGEARQRFPDNPYIYPIDVEVKTGEAVLRNEATPEIAVGIEPDELCVGEAQTLEIVIRGQNLASYWLQVFSRTDPDSLVDDGDLVDDDTVASVMGDDGTSDFVLEREGLHLTELTLGPQVESREVVDPRTTFSKASDERVYCLARLENPDREATTLYMGWEREDRPADPDDSSEWGRTMSIPAQPRYVTFGYRGTGQRPARYRCVIRDEDGVVLGRANYDLSE